MSSKKSTENSKKQCVFLGPYGKDEVEQRYREDLDFVLKRLFSELSDYDYKPFWAQPTTDMQSEIYSLLVTSELAIADLRGLNPNVMYELGIRHAFNLPTILLKDSSTKLPWDIDKNYCLEYPLPIQASHIDHVVKLIRDHIKKVEALDRSKSSYSSFYATSQRTAEIKAISESSDSATTNVLTSLANQVGQLADKINNMSTTPSSPPRTFRDLISTNYDRDMAIKQMSALGHAHSEIAATFGISAGRVSQIVNS